MELMTLSATIGKRSFPVTSWEQVSAAYRSTIEALSLGASQTPPCKIIDDHGNVFAHVSYNGKVWRGERWQFGDTPLYSPRA